MQFRNIFNAIFKHLCRNLLYSFLWKLIRLKSKSFKFYTIFSVTNAIIHVKNAITKIIIIAQNAIQEHI